MRLELAMSETDYRLTRQERKVLERLEQGPVLPDGAHLCFDFIVSDILKRLKDRGFVFLGATGNVFDDDGWQLTNEGLEALR